MSADTLRALVVDDSALYRKVVRTVLEEIPGVKVIGAATNGRVGMDIAKREAPDFVTLDLEMPELDGLGFLREAKSLEKMPAVVMLSARTARGAKVTTEALSLGAFDFILKPQASDLEASLAQIRQQLTPKIQAFLYSKTQHKSQIQEVKSTNVSSVAVAPERLAKPRKPEFVAIGISTGGPAALADLLPRLPSNFPIPILIVQHMPPVFTKTLAEELDSKCRLKVREAQGGESPKPGEVYIAPGGRHMKVESIGPNRVLRITDDPAERSCRPSVDYMFRSLSLNCGLNTIGLIMTGMGDDGLLGCKLLKRQGAMILAQSRETCVVYGMPKCIVDDGLADEVISLRDLANRLTEVAQPTGAVSMPLSSQEVDSVFKLVHELCGIYLDNSKSYLVEARLGELIRRHQCANYEELVRKVRLGTDANLKTSVIDAMTTNETLFFRDESPFEALKFKALPETIDARAKTAYQKRLRIWSAACSTGQEPYSIAMTIAEMIPDFVKWDIQILATDICDRALQQASRGEYSAFEVERGLKPALLGKYFKRVEAAYRVSDALRSMVQFKPFNLTGPMASLGQFDIVFCRNVVIYFNAATRREVFRRIAEVMTPEGYLFVGAQETLTDLGPKFSAHHHCRSTYYRPNLISGTVATTRTTPTAAPIATPMTRGPMRR